MSPRIVTKNRYSVSYRTEPGKAPELKTISRPLWIAIALAAMHLALSLVYASITPYRTGGMVLSSKALAPDIGAPDERAHANYIQHLVDKASFPVLGDPAVDPGENYEAHQPPLFYALAAGWSKLVGAVPVDSSTGGRIRWLNGLIGAVGVIGVYFLALWSTDRPMLGVAAASFAALLPMNVALSGAISNDPLLIGLCTWCTAICCLAMRTGWTMKLAVTVGALTGLALLTKTTALALLPAILAAALLNRERRPSMRMALAAGVAIATLSVPWFARNTSLYGDPLGIQVFQKSFTGNPKADDIIAALAQTHPTEDGQPNLSAGRSEYWKDWVGWWTARSFIGVFGYMDIFLNESSLPRTARDPNTLYRVGLAVLTVLAIGWIWAIYQPEPGTDLRVHLMLGVFTLMVALLFVRFNMQYFQAQARYLFPALAPVSLGFAMGAERLAARRAGVAAAVFVAALGLLNYFAIPKIASEFEVRTQGIVAPQSAPGSK